VPHSLVGPFASSNKKGPLESYILWMEIIE
jgi:hypothetical protein